MDTVDFTKMQVAEIGGFDIDRIGAVRLQLDQLLQEGILVDLDISGESMFTRQADWSDLGIAEDDIRAERLSRGQKYLIAESRIKELRSVTSRMRQTLEKLTHDVGGFRPWRYLHVKSYPRWVDAWGELLADFEDVKVNILIHYDEDIDTLVSDFRKVAEASWKSIKAQGYEWVIFRGVGYNDLDQFTDAVVARALEKMPSISKIESDLVADYRVSVIQGREQVAEMNAQAQIIKAQADAESQVAYYQAALLEDDLHHRKKMHQFEEDERRAQVEAMITAEAEHIRAQLSREVSPILDVFTRVRREMAEAAVEISQSIQKNGFVRGKVATRARGLVEYFDLISIQDDRKLRDALLRLHAAIGPVGDDRGKDTPARSTAEVISALEGIAGMVATAKQDMLSGPSRFSMID